MNTPRNFGEICEIFNSELSVLEKISRSIIYVVTIRKIPPVVETSPNCFNSSTGLGDTPNPSPDSWLATTILFKK